MKISWKLWTTNHPPNKCIYKIVFHQAKRESKICLKINIKMINLKISIENRLSINFIYLFYVII